MNIYFHERTTASATYTSFTVDFPLSVEKFEILGIKHLQNAKKPASSSIEI